MAGSADAEVGEVGGQAAGAVGRAEGGEGHGVLGVQRGGQRRGEVQVAEVRQRAARVQGALVVGEAGEPGALLWRREYAAGTERISKQSVKYCSNKIGMGNRALQP